MVMMYFKAVQISWFELPLVPIRIEIPFAGGQCVDLERFRQHRYVQTHPDPSRIDFVPAEGGWIDDLFVYQASQNLYCVFEMVEILV